MNVFQNLKEFLTKSQSIELQKSNSPNIFCTKVEPHWRSNKSLPAPFVVLISTPVPDGTIVSIAAGNDETPCGEVRNETTKITRQVARFNDLRFVGKSGRGKNFHLTITVHSKPMMIAVVPRAIKVTVDGPRDARAPKSAEGSRKRSFPPSYPPYGGVPMPPVIPMPIFNPALIQQQIMQQQALQRTSFLLAQQQLACCPQPASDSSPETNRLISLTQTTPQSRGAKRPRRSSGSSAGSSPTIWRPF